MSLPVLHYLYTNSKMVLRVLIIAFILFYFQLSKLHNNVMLLHQQSFKDVVLDAVKSIVFEPLLLYQQKGSALFLTYYVEVNSLDFNTLYDAYLLDSAIQH